MYHHSRKGNATLYLKATFSLSLPFKACYHPACIIHHAALYITFGYSQMCDIGSESQKALQIP